MSNLSGEDVDPVLLARHLYEALASGDAGSVRELLHPSFTGRTTEGLPFGLGGDHDGPEAMIQEFWWAIGRHYRARAEPEQFLPLADGGLLVLGRYTGTARDGGGRLDAAFAHVLRFTGGRISELAQYTDSARWAAGRPAPAAGRRDLRVVQYGVDQGVATIRLDRPEAGNTIDLTLVEDFYEAVFRAADDRAVRAVLLCGAGRSLSAGGDLTMFAGLDAGELPRRLRQLVDVYHLALDRLTRIDPPVVCAVRGAAAGGGLGLLHAADVVIAAEDSKFALGYAAIGLASDGGNTWFLPRLVGLRRAQQLMLLGRVLTGPEALDWGLVTEIVPGPPICPASSARKRRRWPRPGRATTPPKASPPSSPTGGRPFTDVKEMSQARH
jgi:2-(1,2-epoxy-1,2-dihydrophenyl)acetyl-CoA isomerase